MKTHWMIYSMAMGLFLLALNIYIFYWLTGLEEVSKKYNLKAKIMVPLIGAIVGAMSIYYAKQSLGYKEDSIELLVYYAGCFLPLAIQQYAKSKTKHNTELAEEDT